MNSFVWCILNDIIQLYYSFKINNNEAIALAILHFCRQKKLNEKGGFWVGLVDLIVKPAIRRFPDQACRKPETSMRFFWRRKHKVAREIAHLILIHNTYYYWLILLNSYKESDFKRNFLKIISALIIMLFLVFSRSQSKLNIHVIARFVRTIIHKKCFIVNNLLVWLF